MSKLEKNLEYQRKVQGDSEELREVLKIRQFLIDTTGHVWSSQWQLLVDVTFEGFPSSRRFYRPSKLYYDLKERILKEK
mgnify:CR=1 FL=1